MDAAIAENRGRASTSMDRSRHYPMGKNFNPIEGILKLHKPVINDPFNQYPQQERLTPSSWFSKRFPGQQQFGSPFLESETVNLNGLTRINPIAINEDFFAAILGGNEHLKHKVIYLVPEKMFLFLDVRAGCYIETTEEKLKLLLSQLLLRCAQEMPPNIDIQNLFLEFRQEKVLNSIVRKAKAILAANENYFKTSNFPRRPKRHEELAISFTRTAIEYYPSQILTVNECYESFSLFCLSKGAEPITRHDFNGMMRRVVKREFKLGLRHDLIPEHQTRQTKGWKGLRRCEAGEGVDAELQHVENKETIRDFDLEAVLENAA